MAWNSPSHARGFARHPAHVLDADARLSHGSRRSFAVTTALPGQASGLRCRCRMDARMGMRAAEDFLPQIMPHDVVGGMPARRSPCPPSGDGACRYLLPGVEAVETFITALYLGGVSIKAARFVVAVQRELAASRTHLRSVGSVLLRAATRRHQEPGVQMPHCAPPVRELRCNGAVLAPGHASMVAISRPSARGEHQAGAIRAVYVKDRPAIAGCRCLLGAAGERARAHRACLAGGREIAVPVDGVEMCTWPCVSSSLRVAAMAARA